MDLKYVLFTLLTSPQVLSSGRSLVNVDRYLKADNISIHGEVSYVMLQKLLCLGHT